MSTDARMIVEYPGVVRYAAEPRRTYLAIAVTHLDGCRGADLAEGEPDDMLQAARVNGAWVVQDARNISWIADPRGPFAAMLDMWAGGERHRDLFHTLPA